MGQEKHFSDEFLNAFVDNQLAPEEKSRAYVEISGNENLNRQVCEIRKLRDLVQLAYRDIPLTPSRPEVHAHRGIRLRAGVAAAAVLALGLAIGVQIDVSETTSDTTATTLQSVGPARMSRAPVVTAAPHAKSAARRPVAARPTAVVPPVTIPAIPKVAIEPATIQPALLIDAEETQITRYAPARLDTPAGEVRNKVLIHIAHDDNLRLAQALEEVENLLRFYRERQQSARVEVVINGRGLDLVRRDTSQYAAQISRLQKEFDNLTFAACQNTIDRVRREQGIVVRLLPGVVVIDSGMAEIMRRQHQGWAYLQV